MFSRNSSSLVARIQLAENSQYYWTLSILVDQALGILTAAMQLAVSITFDLFLWFYITFEKESLFRSILFVEGFLETFSSGVVDIQEDHLWKFHIDKLAKNMTHYFNIISNISN